MAEFQWVIKKNQQQFQMVVYQQVISDHSGVLYVQPSNVSGATITMSPPLVSASLGSATLRYSYWKTSTRDMERRP